jgi:uncharacterized RDD family membrane protein YckC
MTEGGAAVPPDLSTPSLRRRIASFLYEGVLLFGVLMIAGYLYSSLTQQRHALVGRHGLQGFLFIILAIYFVWFWSHGGQTVAMKAWHIRVVDRAGGPVSELRGLARFLLAWLWFAPALLVLAARDIHDGPTITAVLIAGVAGYAFATRLHPSRQFPHDVLAGTRLITWRPQAAG